jgi:ribosomal protein S18 acetylase RimI-like enzyme
VQASLPRPFLRDAREPDAEEILALWRELMALHVQIDPRFELADRADERFLSYLDLAQNRDDYCVRVATLNHGVVGFSVSCVLPNSPVYAKRWIGYINDLCVSSSHRRQGIGRMLVQDAAEWLRGAGAESIEVYIALANEPARRFWRRVGGQDYLERLALDLGPS